MDNNNKKYDLTLLKRISGEDEKFIVDMIETFRGTAPGVLKRMESFLLQERYEALSREAHRFIPGISFLGVKDIESDLVSIEDYSKSITNLDKLPDLFSSVKEKVESLIQNLTSDFNLKQL